MEERVIYCNARVTFRLDLSNVATSNAISKNTLKLNCPKTKRQVGIDAKALFGTLLFSCKQTSCPFNPDFNLENPDLTSHPSSQ